MAEGLDSAGLSSGGSPGQAVPHGGGAVGGVSSRVGGVKSLLLGQRQHHGVGLEGKGWRLAFERARTHTHKNKHSPETWTS